VGGRAAVGSDGVLELSLHILDVLENAIEASATRVELSIEEDLEGDRLAIEVVDNGKGMDEGTLARVLDPFFTTRRTRHVGLGLPLFAAAAERCNGALHVESQVGQGTRVVATFQHSHIDRAPLGDVKGTLLAFLMAERPVDLRPGRLAIRLGGAGGCCREQAGQERKPACWEIGAGFERHAKRAPRWNWTGCSPD